jgi:heat shock protein HtpX
MNASCNRAVRGSSPRVGSASNPAVPGPLTIGSAYRLLAVSVAECRQILQALRSAELTVWAVHRRAEADDVSVRVDDTEMNLDGVERGKPCIGRGPRLVAVAFAPMYEQIARNKRRAVVYVVLFFAVWVGIGALIGWLVSAASARPSGAGSSGVGDVVVGVVIAGLLALAGIGYTLSSGARLVLAVSGARLADPGQYRQLHDIVEALAIGDGLPKPQVYVIDDESPNAFATGTGPGRAAITATTGLLATMNREELEGVIGHEMSHIKNYDVRLILVVSTLIGLAGLLASVIWRSAFYVRPRGRDNSGQLMLLVFAAGLLLGVVAFIVGPIIRLALSRRRESLADVSGVELTRNPAGLISALQKLQSNDKPFAKFNHATAAMCIDDPLQHHESWFHHLFDTHPPIAERIAVLEHIARGESV